MRKLLIILFLFISLIASATNYYVKNGGSDAADGLSDGTAWETIAKVDTVWAAGTFAPGDNIYFKRGDTFYGSIRVTESGTSGNPITIGAYGTGANPIIYGHTTLTSWVDEGGGIYSKAVIPESAINMVIIDGVEYAMGREPEASEGYNTYGVIVKSVSPLTVAADTITDSDYLDSDIIDWTGAEIVLRKNDYLLVRCSIDSHISDTIAYNDLGGTSAYFGTATFGYFIQNDIRTLDTFGEWYYSSNTFYMYFGANDPDDYTVEVATIDNLIYIAGYDYIDIENIELQRANVAGISLTGSSGNYVTYCNLNNCTIDFSGSDGCYAYYVSYSTFDSLTISHSARSGIYGHNGSNCSITYCDISYSGMILGRANAGSYANGIRNNYLTTTIIQYNTVEYSGSDGIYFQGNDTEIRNNLINYSSMVVSDRGGIYTGGSINTGRIIDGNIVLNTYGNNTGGYSWRRYARGIYLDAYGSGVTVTNNTIAYSGDHGICINGGHSNTIRNNLSYANVNSAFYIQDISTLSNPYDNIVTVNQFICRDVGTSAFRGWASNAVTIAAFTRLDSNYYARPIDDDDIVYLYTPGAMTLAAWQTLSSLDVETQGSPKAITNTGELYFYYNASNLAIEQLIPRPMIGIDGTEYNDVSVNIPAWRGILLIESASSFPSGTQVYATPDSTQTKYMKTSDGKYIIIVQ